VFAGRGEPDVGLAIHDAGPTKTGAMASAMREVDLDGDGACSYADVLAAQWAIAPPLVAQLVANAMNVHGVRVVCCIALILPFIARRCRGLGGHGDG
jgi:hypothetical protein